MFYRPNKQKKIKLNKIKFRQGIQIIPNVFTLGNAFFGLCSVIFAAQQSWIAASFCVFVGGLMDALDGQIARFVRASSAFGLQLDSLCDAITFCLAPAFLIYIWQLKRLGAIGLIVCGLFLAAGLLRLAKFNITHSEQSDNFIGVPTPFAACFLAAFVLKFHQLSFKNIFGLFLLLFIMLTLSCLMVDTVRIPTFKHAKKKLYLLVVGLFTVGAIALGFVTVIFYIFASYIIFALGKSIYCRTVQIINYIKLRYRLGAHYQDLRELFSHK